MSVSGGLLFTVRHHLHTVCLLPRAGSITTIIVIIVSIVVVCGVSGGLIFSARHYLPAGAGGGRTWTQPQLQVSFHLGRGPF
jgi:hypothetical protein